MRSNNSTSSQIHVTNCIECSKWFLVFNTLVSLAYLLVAAFVTHKLKKQLKFFNFLVIATFCVIIVTRYIIDGYMYYECHDD